MKLSRLQEASKALEIGQSVLLPPVLDRVELLLTILPEEPSEIASLTAGQVSEETAPLWRAGERGRVEGTLPKC